MLRNVDKLRAAPVHGVGCTRHANCLLNFLWVLPKISFCDFLENVFLRFLLPISSKIFAIERWPILGWSNQWDIPQTGTSVHFSMLRTICRPLDEAYDDQMTGPTFFITHWRCLHPRNLFWFSNWGFEHAFSLAREYGAIWLAMDSASVLNPSYLQFSPE